MTSSTLPTRYYYLSQLGHQSEDLILDRSSADRPFALPCHGRQGFDLVYLEQAWTKFDAQIGQEEPDYGEIGCEEINQNRYNRFSSQLSLQNSQNFQRLNLIVLIGRILSKIPAHYPLRSQRCQPRLSSD